MISKNVLNLKFRRNEFSSKLESQMAFKKLTWFDKNLSKADINNKLLEISLR